MINTKNLRIGLLIAAIVLALYDLYNKEIAHPFKSDRDFLVEPYGIRSNELRRKLKLPVIEKWMTPVTEEKNYTETHRWENTKEYPDYGQLLHSFKNVDVNKKTLQIIWEDDAFRRKINDSVFQQFDIYATVEGDTISKRNGQIFYEYRSKLDLFGEVKLDEHGIDSVAKTWHLNDLVKGK